MISKLINLCIFISENCEADVFVHYSPHVNWVDVTVHGDGYGKGGESTTNKITLGSESTSKNLSKIIEELKRLI